MNWTNRHYEWIGLDRGIRHDRARYLQAIDTIFFNAARLDRSIGLKGRDYFEIAKPSIDDIPE